jgi:hypothetical protein
MSAPPSDRRTSRVANGEGEVDPSFGVSGAYRYVTVASL